LENGGPSAGPASRALAECTTPAGKFVNDQAATFTMVHCAPTKHEAYAAAAESFVWYVRHGAALIGSVAEWLEGTDLQSYSYTAAPLEHERSGALDHLTFDFLYDTGSAVIGDPEVCIATAKRYEGAGCDLLLCLVNPLKIPHDKVMQSIDLLGKEVLPAFH
jgi:hypothetical protein